MTKRIKAHPLFAVWRPDEAVECLDVPNDTYQFVWDVIMPLLPKRQEHACDPVYPLRNFWSQVPKHHRIQLNKAADQHEAEYRKVVGEKV